MVHFSLRAFVAILIFLNVSSVSAHNKVVVIPLGGDDAPAPIKYAIGETGPAGGIVFHVTNDGLNGLEAALVDQDEAPWNCEDVDVVGVDNLSTSDSGAMNTPLIAVACGGAAAVAAVYLWPNGQTDGFLPNKEELGLLYDQRNIDGLVGSFASDRYWSSSENSTGFAWVQYFSGINNIQAVENKALTNSVRAVRAF